MINFLERLAAVYDTVENIFDYDMDVMESEVFNLTHNNKTSYLLFTAPVQILSDLHLLFLIRKDRENRNRIMNMLRHCEEWGVCN